MSSMKDIIRTSVALGEAIKTSRKERKLKVTDIAARAGRSRDILHRLEKGQDITVHSLFDLLRAMGLVIRIETAGLPTLEEMRARFAAELDDEDDSAA
jgi:HTH-type transcriptional regulator/antitoxin HipB